MISPSDCQGYKAIWLKILALKFSTEIKPHITCFNYNILGQNILGEHFSILSNFPLF